MNEKSEMFAMLRPQILLMAGADLGEDIVTAITLALEPYDLVKSERAVVVYDNTDKQLFGRFFVAKTALGLSPRTIAYYRETLREFFEWCKKHIQDVTTEDVRMFIAHKKMQGNSASSQDNLRRNLSSFFTFMHEEGLIESNPLIRIKKIRQPKVVKLPFSEDELELMRNAVENVRDRAFIEFLISTGCRVSEAISVNRADIEWDMSRVMVKGKGNKFRWVYLNARSAVALRAYLETRDDNEPALFGTRATYLRADGTRAPRRFEISGAGNMVRKLGRKVGVDNAHPHRFRRTAATLALRRGMPIEQVSKILGHASLNTTTIYANSTEDDLAIAHRKYLS